MPTLIEQANAKLGKRAQLIAENRAVVDRAETEGRDLTGEDRSELDRRYAEIDTLKADAEALEKQTALEAEVVEPRSRPIERPAGSQETPESKVAADEAREAADFETFLRTGRVTPEAEERALQANVDTSGGFLVAPQMFVRELIKAVDNAVVIRGLARVFTLTDAESMGVPTLDADPADADWTSELATGSEDSTMAFGKRELRPHPLAKRIKVSNKLIRVSAIGIESLIRDRLAYKFGVTLEKAYMTGTGAQQPLGVFTASADGISTARDVSDGNSTTSIAFDGLKNAKYALKGQYQGDSSLRWIFHRDVVKEIDKLKDGNGQYIWQASVVAGRPDQMLGIPVLQSEYAPSTLTTGLYVGILGVFRYYWIADALGMTVQRLNELYAETNQTGFIGRFETDGAPVLEEAFVRVKLT